MKLKFTSCLLVLLAVAGSLFAAAPTVPASSAVFSALNGASFTLTFTKGNGTNRIVVVKEGSAVTGVPVDGVDYNANANFATAGTAFSGAGEYVVYKGTGNSVVIKKLKPATAYYISVYEYNGAAATTQYLQLPLNGSQATVSVPTIQASAVTFTAIAGNTVTVNWASGNGSSRLVVARKGAAVNAVPEDLKDYSPSGVFGSGNAVSTDNYAVYKSTGNKIVVTNLEPGVAYYFAVFELNGTSEPVYMLSPATGSVTTNTGPTEASKSMSFSNIDGNKLTTSFAMGNGAHHLIIARKNQPVSAIPVNGVTYTPNTAFGSGTAIAPGEFVLNTLNEDRTFTNLEQGTTYYFRVYDYDVDANGNTFYLTSAFLEKSQMTAVAPSVQASGINFSNITGSSATIKFTAGNGAFRLVVMKEGSPVDAIPTDLVRYNGNAVFGTGNQVSPGNYVIGSINGVNITPTSLVLGVTYYVAVFEYNGNNGPVYLKPAATASITMPAEPTAPGTTFTTTLIEGNAIRTQWTNGDGSRRLVVARKGSPVTARPVDGTVYTANGHFGQGTELTTGEFAVYDGVGGSFTLDDLEIASTYYLAVFEYNLSGTQPDYLISSFLSGNATTTAAPGVQTSAITAGSIQSAQATISFTKGNGAGRIFLIREGSPVNTVPENLVSYSYSGNAYGAAQVGTGNYLVGKTNTNTPFTVTGLAASTTYYIAAFEYNGSTGPVYMTPAGTASFTTAAGSGVVAPTVAATNATFSSIDGNKLTFNWTNGNGSNRIVVASKNAPVSFVPANGTTYTANAIFGSGTDMGSGQYVVYNGSSTSVPVTGLLGSTTYYFTVFEYNGAGGNTRYLTGSVLSAGQSTVTSPTGGSSNIVTTIGNQSLTLQWSKGTGAGRLMVMKEGSAVTAMPATLSSYPASTTFGNGAQLAAGEYAVYSGTGNAVTVTGLAGNKTYYFSVFEYNGSDAPVYNTTNVVSGNTTTLPLPLTWMYFTAKAQNGEVKLEWGTANEQHTAYFVIERSAGAGFVSKDTVPAAGSGNHDYVYTDKSSASANVMYRIKQVDIDGRYAYSKQVTIHTTTTETGISLYPNPVQRDCIIRVPDELLGANVQLYDMSGAIVKTFKAIAQQRVNLQTLTPGVYTVVIRKGVQQYSSRLVKQ